MTEVYVVLSTYNGEQFLIPQLKSILEQESVQIKLLIRDDGSTDGTKEILNSYAKKYANISLEYGHNMGVVKSFMRLLKNVPPHAKFIAFSDQDDIWRLDKIIRAINKINELSSGPVLYCSCYSAVDEDGKLLWESSAPPRDITFRNAVLQNITTGCTIVLNKNLLDILKADQVNTGKIIMHDWWVYLVATCFGRTIYDATPSMYYRQHGGNVVGAKNGFTFWTERLKRFLFHRGNYSRISQAREFLRLYKQNMSSEDANILTEFIAHREGGLLERTRYAFRTPLYMQKKIDNIIIKLQLIIRTVN